MNGNQKIKVIKKSAMGKHPRSDNKRKRAAASDIASTVAAWVSELKVRKRNDAKIAIARFVEQTSQSSGIVISSPGLAP